MKLELLDKKSLAEALYEQTAPGLAVEEWLAMGQRERRARRLRRVSAVSALLAGLALGWLAMNPAKQAPAQAIVSSPPERPAIRELTDDELLEMFSDQGAMLVDLGQGRQQLIVFSQQP